jgi:hypothetical protein
MFLSTRTMGSGIGVWVGFEATSERTSLTAVSPDEVGVQVGFTTEVARAPMNWGRPSKKRESASRSRRRPMIAVWMPHLLAALLDGAESKEDPQ